MGRAYKGGFAYFGHTTYVYASMWGAKICVPNALSASPVKWSADYNFVIGRAQKLIGGNRPSANFPTVPKMAVSLPTRHGET
jgi:hypothetical protein